MVDMVEEWEVVEDDGFVFKRPKKRNDIVTVEEVNEMTEVEVVPIKVAGESPDSVRDLYEHPIQKLHLEVEYYEDFIDRMRGMVYREDILCKLVERELMHDICGDIVWETPRHLIHALTDGSKRRRLDSCSPFPIMESKN